MGVLATLFCILGLVLTVVVVALLGVIEPESEIARMRAELDVFSPALDKYYLRTGYVIQVDRRHRYQAEKLERVEGHSTA